MLLFQHPSDCWMTVRLLLHGCEALTLVRGGGVQKKDGETVPHDKNRLPPPNSPLCSPSSASLPFKSVSVCVTMPNPLCTSGQGTRPQQNMDEGGGRLLTFLNQSHYPTYNQSIAFFWHCISITLKTLWKKVVPYSPVKSTPWPSWQYN